MVNYKRVVCEVAVVALLATITAAAPAPDCKENHYDQSQNGTENYRLNIDGFVIAIAPAESFVPVGTDIDIEGLLDVFNDIKKPKPSTESSALKPDESKPDDAKPQESKPGASEKSVMPLADISMDSTQPETKGQKKDAGRKQVKGQRLKTLLANMLVPLLRKAHAHEN